MCCSRAPSSLAATPDPISGANSTPNPSFLYCQPKNRAICPTVDAAAAPHHIAANSGPMTTRSRLAVTMPRLLGSKRSVSLLKVHDCPLLKRTALQAFFDASDGELCFRIGEQVSTCQAKLCNPMQGGGASA